MTEFVGRTGALRLYSYPETRGTGPLPSAYARNFAQGPTVDTDLTTGGVQIPWDFIEGDSALGVDAPITPHVTGRMIFRGSVVVKNTSGAPADVSLQVEVEGSPLLVPLIAATVPANGVMTLPFVILSQSLFTVGALKNIQVLMIAASDGALSLATDGSTLEIQEMQFAN